MHSYNLHMLGAGSYHVQQIKKNQFHESTDRSEIHLQSFLSLLKVTNWLFHRPICTSWRWWTQLRHAHCRMFQHKYLWFDTDHPQALVGLWRAILSDSSSPGIHLMGEVSGYGSHPVLRTPVVQGAVLSSGRRCLSNLHGARRLLNALAASAFIKNSAFLLLCIAFNSAIASCTVNKCITCPTVTNCSPVYSPVSMLAVLYCCLLGY